MRTNTLKIILFIVIAFIHFGVPGLDAAKPSFVYEAKSIAEEKKRYLIKLEQDERKCDLAIINTKNLIARSKNRPYLPELKLRLAELYIERSRIVYFLRNSQNDADQKRALDQYESNVLKQQAIEIYQRILSDFSEYADRDKVHFFLAHEFHELGKVTEMVDQYRVLIQDYPNSRYTPESHLLLGDYYFNQKQDVERAKRHYETVLNYINSPAAAVARYKLAWCCINLADYKGALALFEASVRSTAAGKDLDIDTYRRVDVRLESLTDMAFCYPEVYKDAKPREALDYFKRFAWSRPVYTAVLEKLAYRYYVKKKWEIAAAVYRELADLRQDPDKLIAYAKHIFECTRVLGTYQHAEKDVQIIVRALEIEKFSAHLSDSAKENMINDYEIFARDIITHLHAKANRTESKQDYKIAAEAYRHYLDFFKESPVATEMALNYAEALFSSDQYLDAGRQYEKNSPAAVENNKQRREMLYSAVIAYYQALKHKSELNYYQAAFARAGLRTAGNQYVNEFPDSTFAAEVQFNVAWAAYDAGEYEAAINDFSNFVSNYPDHRATPAAVHLVLDAFHQLENDEGLIRYGKSLLQAGTLRDPELVSEVTQIVRSAESKVVSTMTMAALDDWENGRDELMQVVDQEEKGAMGEQALNALVISSRDNEDLPTLYQAVDKLARQYPQSLHLKDSLGIAIDTSLKIGQYRLLADYLEDYVHRFPKDEQVPELTLQAARIREGLGQYAAANHDYHRFLSTGKASQQQMDDIVLAMIDNARQSGTPESPGKIFADYAGKLSDPPRLRANAELAVLNYQADRRSRAQRYSRAVKKAYTPRLGEQQPELRDLVAELNYFEVYSNSGPYFKLRLKDKIDNTVVARKNQLLQELEAGYQAVMAYKSPHWALIACYRAGELNREFADFLTQSPPPEGLSDQQRQQYKQLIQQKAQAYVDKADQYALTCVEMGRKWEICDPSLTVYFMPVDYPQTGGRRLDSLSSGDPSTEISKQSLQDQEFLRLYEKMIETSDPSPTMVQLAKAYLSRGDYRQAFLCAQNGMAKLDGGQNRTEADLLNVIGLSYLYGGQDQEAREAFKKALQRDPQAGAARVNLAGVYIRYGHQQKASEVTTGLDSSQVISNDVHPRIGAIYNEFSVQAN